MRTNNYGLILNIIDDSKIYIIYCYYYYDIKDLVLKHQHIRILRLLYYMQVISFQLA